jgi:multisubunit Na+/H+ antiporter MnhG subunit
MRRVFSYVFFLLGLLVMVLSILNIFRLLDLQVDLWVAVAMAGFGLILCLIAFFMLSPDGGPNTDELT